MDETKHQEEAVLPASRAPELEFLMKILYGSNVIHRIDSIDGSPIMKGARLSNSAQVASAGHRSSNYDNRKFRQ